MMPLQVQAGLTGLGRARRVVIARGPARGPVAARLLLVHRDLELSLAGSLKWPREVVTDLSAEIETRSLNAPSCPGSG